MYYIFKCDRNNLTLTKQRTHQAARSAGPDFSGGGGASANGCIAGGIATINRSPVLDGLPRINHNNFTSDGFSFVASNLYSLSLIEEVELNIGNLLGDIRTG